MREKGAMGKVDGKAGDELRSRPTLVENLEIHDRPQAVKRNVMDGMTKKKER